MRCKIALCLLALLATAKPPAAAEQQPAERQPAERQAIERQPAQQQAADERVAIELLIVAHAKTHGLPAALVRLVVRRESNFNPRAVYRGNYGLMQIRLGTARALGYRGTAEGLLDPATNMTYGVTYLAGAYRAAHGNEARTILLYASGYHDVH
jgi:soluble lytic murein transglycosylase-like protein